jgi:hypothetical protein
MLSDTNENDRMKKILNAYLTKKKKEKKSEENIFFFVLTRNYMMKRL